MRCGDTLLIPAPGTCEETPHLWIVATDPDPLCIVVSLSSLRNNKDQTVVLRPKDHPFIVKDTTVLYSYAEIVDADHLDRQVKEGAALPHTCCSGDLLKLVRDGIMASPFSSRKIQMFFKEHS